MNTKNNVLILSLLLLCFSAIKAEKPHVLASASIFQDMAKNIGGDLITTDLIVPIGGDPHLYDPVPKDAKKVVAADLILINGLTFEGWIKKLVANAGTQATSVLITEGVDAIRSTEYENATDPHAWMSAENGKIYAKNIYEALRNIDPKNEKQYEENYTKYIAQLDALHKYIHEQIQNIPEDQRVLVTSHDAFEYFGKEYGLQLEAIVGISTEAEAQTSDLIRVTKAIKDSGIKAVFIESTINPKMIKQLAKDNNVIIGGELFADSLGELDGPAGTYIGMLKTNTDNIVRGLTKGEELRHKHQDQSSSTNWIWYLGLGLAFILLLFLVIKKMT